MSRIKRKQAKKLQKRAFPALFELDLYGRQEGISSVKNSPVCTSALKASFFEDESAGLNAEPELFSVGNAFEGTDESGAGMQLTSRMCSLADERKNCAGVRSADGTELQLTSGICSLADETKNFAREHEDLGRCSLTHKADLAGVGEVSQMCSLANETKNFAREREGLGMCSLTHETDFARVGEASRTCSLADEMRNLAGVHAEVGRCSLGNKEENLVRVDEEAGRCSLADEVRSFARVPEGLEIGCLAAEDGKLAGELETMGGCSLAAEGEMLGGVGGHLGSNGEMLAGEGCAGLRIEGEGGSVADKYRIRTGKPGRQGFWGRFLGTMFLDTSSCKALEKEQCSLFNRRIYRPKSGWTETYSPSNREGEYYRYCYLPEGKRQVKTVHIKGGNVNSLSARRRRAEIDEAIALGRSPYEIVELC